MHTCSIQSKTTQKNSRKHLEEQKLEVRNNSKSTQLNSGKNSCTGYTGGPAPAHPKATGYTGALAPVHPDSAVGIRSWKTQHHRLHRCPLDKHRSMHHVILQRPCFQAWESFYFTGYTGGLTLEHRCIHPCNDRRLCLGNWRNSSAPVTPVPLRNIHRCITVRLSQCQDVNGYYLVLVWPVALMLPLRSIRCLRLSGQILSNG